MNYFTDKDRERLIRIDERVNFLYRERELDRLKLGCVERQLKSKISKRLFAWVVGIIGTLTCTIVTLLYYGIKIINDFKGSI